MDDRLLVASEVAARIRVPVATLRDWRYRNKGPRSARIGRRVMYRESDVTAWVEEQFRISNGGDAA
jgi:predicted DNA-binding transcriptional regulator AlpA